MNGYGLEVQIHQALRVMGRGVAHRQHQLEGLLLLVPGSEACAVNDTDVAAGVDELVQRRTGAEGAPRDRGRFVAGWR